MLGSLFNPLLQPQVPDFGRNAIIPKAINSQYTTAKGNLVNAHNFKLQYPPEVTLPNTYTKAGESQNRFPEPLPQDLLNIKYPQYSTSSHALLENQRVGAQLGMADVYRDTPYQDWTYGTQYYTLYTGTNPKQLITPVIYPQAYRAETWAQDTVTFPQVNRQDTEDITDLSIDYTCKGCEIPSASLGSPVFYEPRNPNAPLPVAAFPGEYPNIGYYTAKEFGRNTRDWPQPVNPIVELQRRRMGLPSPPIPEDYDNYLQRELTHGFDFS